MIGAASGEAGASLVGRRRGHHSGDVDVEGLGKAQADVEVGRHYLRQKSMCQPPVRLHMCLRNTGSPPHSIWAAVSCHGRGSLLPIVLAITDTIAICKRKAVRRTEQEPACEPASRHRMQVLMERQLALLREKQVRRAY